LVGSVAGGIVAATAGLSVIGVIGSIASALGNGVKMDNDGLNQTIAAVALAAAGGAIGGAIGGGLYDKFRDPTDIDTLFGISVEADSGLKGGGGGVIVGTVVSVTGLIGYLIYRSPASPNQTDDEKQSEPPNKM
jgi:hypothetical protein